MASRAVASSWTFRLLRQSIRTPTRVHGCPGATRAIQQSRGYASGGGSHGTHKTGSEWPWAIGSLAVTLPATYYLLQPQLNKPSHGDDSHGHESHEADSSGEKDSATAEDNGDDEEENAEKDEEASKVEDGEKVDEESKQDGSEKPNESSEEEKTEPADEEAADTDGLDEKDAGHPHKPAGGHGTQSGKQEGLSNADTRHSTDPTEGGKMSSKGEGAPETAKSKGTVQIDRAGK